MWVEPTVSMEEVTSDYQAQSKFAHPDGTQEPEERKVSEDRTKRLTLAYEAIQKTRHSTTQRGFLDLPCTTG